MPVDQEFGSKHRWTVDTLGAKRETSFTESALQWVGCRRSALSGADGHASQWDRRGLAGSPDRQRRGTVVRVVVQAGATRDGSPRRFAEAGNRSWRPAIAGRVRRSVVCVAVTGLGPAIGSVRAMAGVPVRRSCGCGVPVPGSGRPRPPQLQDRLPTGRGPTVPRRRRLRTPGHRLPEGAPRRGGARRGGPGPAARPIRAGGLTPLAPGHPDLGTGLQPLVHRGRHGQIERLRVG